MFRKGSENMQMHDESSETQKASDYQDEPVSNRYFRPETGTHPGGISAQGELALPTEAPERAGQ